jgi:hypothetical protein
MSILQAIRVLILKASEHLRDFGTASIEEGIKVKIDEAHQLGFIQVDGCGR